MASPSPTGTARRGSFSPVAGSDRKAEKGVTPALLSAIYGKPLMLYAVGVGPLLSEHGRQYTKVIGDLAPRITVRDAASKSLFEQFNESNVNEQGVKQKPYDQST